MDYFKKETETNNDDSIRPVFYWAPPKGSNVISWFMPGADREFARKHPKAYPLIYLCGLIALFLPAAIYFICGSTGAAGDPGSGWVMLGLIGCFLLGFALFNIVAAWVRQYLGHWVTIICLIAGGAMLALSLHIMG